MLCDLGQATGVLTVSHHPKAAKISSSVLVAHVLNERKCQRGKVMDCFIYVLLRKVAFLYNRYHLGYYGNTRGYISELHPPGDLFIIHSKRISTIVYSKMAKEMHSDHEIRI